MLIKYIFKRDEKNCDAKNTIYLDILLLYLQFSRRVTLGTIYVIFRGISLNILLLHKKCSLIYQNNVFVFHFIFIFKIRDNTYFFREMKTRLINRQD